MGRDCSMCSSKRGKSVPVSRRGALRLLNIRSSIVGHYRDRRYKDSPRAASGKTAAAPTRGFERESRTG